MMDFQNKRMAVIGLGKSGQAAARLGHALGGRIFLSEQGPEDRVDSGFLSWVRENGIQAEFGGHSQRGIQNNDVAIVSPGVPVNSSPLVWAREAGIPVVGELEFAFCVCPCPVIAVTGSNGKTTVTTLIGRVLAEAGYQVFVGGNIGCPLSDHVLGLTRNHWAVLETSSFQLETIDTFHPHIAVLLNISQNHLDRHTDMEEYVQAKARIFENQNADDFAVLNAQEGVIRKISGSIRSQLKWFNTQEAGFDLSVNPNFSAVSAVAEVLGIPSSCCDRVFESFDGIEHRMERVAVIDGVEFINDSKSTTTEATRWALSRLAPPLVWICGGRDKNLDFGVLREMAAQKVKRIIAIGEAKDKVRGVFEGLVPVECFSDFEQAVYAAARGAERGDTVLLSPMCASFDMFDNFEHRGREFKRLVRRLSGGGI